MKVTLGYDRGMKVYLGADHRGFELKEEVKVWLAEWGVEGEDKGAFELIPGDDYGDYAKRVVEVMMIEGGVSRGILICGSGHGMDISANRFAGIRAILGFNVEVVRQGREDEDANVLVLPSDWVSFEEAKERVKVFLETPFSGEERHMRRIGKLSKL